METNDPSAQSRLLKITKDYWFLITFVLSLAVSGVYMAIFQVTPWDKYRQIQTNRERVALHDTIGQRLLEAGQFEPARNEFDRALKLEPLDEAAQQGQYLAELFVALPLPTWEPAVWSAFRDPLMQLAKERGQRFGHVFEKYLGDVEQRIGNAVGAEQHYKRALDMKPDYSDALYSSAWLSYSSEPPDVSRMEESFRRMTKADPYDYRGFHGLGYALYMHALSVQGDARTGLMKDAAEQSRRAANLKFEQLNVTMDLGEVARTVLPELSKFLHEAALRFLDNPETAKLRQVHAPLQAHLLRREAFVYIVSDAERRAWINYQLALDHLAILRQRGTAADAAALRSGRESHDQLLQRARQLDPERTIYPIYTDQLTILNEFLPEQRN